MAVLLAVRDLVFRSKIEAAARRLELPVVAAPRGQPLPDAVRALGPRAVIADLGEPDMLEALRAVRRDAPDLRVVAFVGHVREDLVEAARELGAEVYTRGQFTARLDALLSEEIRRAEPPSPA